MSDIEIGVNPVEFQPAGEVPKWKPGTIASASDPISGTVKDYMWVGATGGSTAAGDVMVVNPVNWNAALLTSTNGAAGAGTGYPVGVCLSAIPVGGYGWVQIYGQCSLRVTAATAIGTQLNTTATGGGLSATATAATTSRIAGATLTVAAGAAGVAAGFVSYPTVGQVN